MNWKKDMVLPATNWATRYR